MSIVLDLGRLVDVREPILDRQLLALSVELSSDLLALLGEFFLILRHLFKKPHQQETSHKAGTFGPPQDRNLLLSDGPENQQLTALGRTVAALPLHPRLGTMLAHAASDGLAEDAALIGALIQEGTGGRRAGRAGQVRCGDVFAQRDALEKGPVRTRVMRVQAQLMRGLRRLGIPSEADLVRAAQDDRDDALCQHLLRGWPDRVARRRDLTSDRMVLVGGRGALLMKESVVQDDEFMVALDVDAGRRGEFARARVRSAARVDKAWLLADPNCRTEEVYLWDEADRRVCCRRRTLYLDLVLADEPSAILDEIAAANILAERVGAWLDDLVAGSQGLRQFLNRCRLLAAMMPELGFPEPVEEMLRTALPGLCQGQRAWNALVKAPWRRTLERQLDYHQQEALRTHAPSEIVVASGASRALHYGEDGPPVLAVKVQELFGTTQSPTVARGRMKVRLHLLDPAGRPLQVTDDLESFWTRTWVSVRKEMRSRYPKHRWPEDPLSATASRHSVKRR